MESLYGVWVTPGAQEKLPGTMPIFTDKCVVRHIIPGGSGGGKEVWGKMSQSGTSWKPFLYQIRYLFPLVPAVFG